MADKSEALRRRVAEVIQRRRAAGETLEQIADSIGVHWITVWKWEQGRHIRESALSLLALVLDDEDDTPAAQVAA